MTTLIKNATIINEGEKFVGNVLIKDDFIDRISKSEINVVADNHIDAEGLLLMPGVIDDQVHFREPGLEHKADIASESRAAVAGGITSFMEMPNTNPQTTTVDLLEQKFKRASEVSPANYSFYIGATNNNIGEVLKANPKNVCGIKCFMGSSTGNMLVEGEGLETLFKHAHMLVATHCEEESVIKSNIEYFRGRYGENLPVKYHPLIRSHEACMLSTQKAVSLANKYNTRLHVLHLSTAGEMDLFSIGELSQKQITAEVCVHHLWFTDTDYDKYGAFIKWNPAVKKIDDRDALRKALLEGRIDVVATDHAPHTLDEKQNSYFKAPSGGPLVQHSLPAMLEMVKNGVFSYEQVVEKMCHNPAILFQIENRGFIREGYKADIVLVDPNKPWTVSTENILYKCGWSPFEKHQFSHKVEHTFVNGHPAYSDGVFDLSRKGERLIFNR
jgi:dihydroorotase